MTPTPMPGDRDTLAAALPSLTPHPVDRPVLAADVLHQDYEREGCCQSCDCYGAVGVNGYCRRCRPARRDDIQAEGGVK